MSEEVVVEETTPDVSTAGEAVPETVDSGDQATEQPDSGGKSVLGSVGDEQEKPAEDVQHDSEGNKTENEVEKELASDVAYDLAVPEGLEVDEKLIESFKSLASEQNLTSDAFQAIGQLQLDA